jgi:dihydroflavonol-4-reductase
VQDIAGQIEWVEGDILDLAALSRAMAGVTVVIHTAAVISFNPADRTRMHKINVEGTANIVNVCLANGVSKLCYVSSVAALGRKKNDHQISEDSKWEHSAYNSYYGQTKYLAELEVWRGMAEGLSGVIINPSIILGPGNWGQGSTKLFKYVWDEHAFYTGGSISYVDVRDVAQIIFQLIRSEITLERFILNGGNIKIKELFEEIATHFGKKPPYLQVNSLLASIVWRLEYVRSLITGKEPIITRETAQAAQKEYTYINEKVKQKLHYSFYPIEDTIAWTCSELVKHNK